MDGPEKHPPLVWIDLEMTGLEPESHHILEIATIVTDENLEIVAEGPDLVVHQPEEVLAAMNPWCVEHHGQSGLTQAVRESKISSAEAEEQTLEFLREHTTEGASPLCGNSVWKDRLFLMRRMPRVDTFLHYRIIDVTSIKVLAHRWYPDAAPPAKGDGHRALADIRESIAELRYYRSHVFR